MLDRELLKDIGFERGKGWDHEVWVYNGQFWVHFGDYDHGRWPTTATHVEGTRVTRKHLFTCFLKAILDDCHESHMEREQE